MMDIQTIKPVHTVVVGDLLVHADGGPDIEVTRIERLNKGTVRFHSPDEGYSDAPLNAMVATRNTTARVFLLPRREKEEPKP